MVKVDLGCHIDGYIAVGAHTVVVGHTPAPEAPVTGPRADVLQAAWTAARVAANLIQPGNTNAQVTSAVQKVAEAYGVKAIHGTVMHEMKRFVIDGKKVILLRDEGEEKVEPCTFEKFEVYSIDVAMSSGEGKPRQTDLRTTVFKRQVCTYAPTY
jgi:methionine aminopeptidase